MIKRSPTPTGYRRSGHLYLRKYRSHKTGEWVYIYARKENKFYTLAKR